MALRCGSVALHSRAHDGELSLFLQLHNFFSYLMDHFTPSSSKESKFPWAVCRRGTGSSAACTLYWFVALQDGKGGQESLKSDGVRHVDGE